MFCWHDFADWLNLNLLWFCIFAFIVVVALMVWAPLLRPRWLKFSVRGVGIVIGLLVVVPLAIIVVWASADPRPETTIVKSGTGLREARLWYEPGLLGRDSTEVKIKSSSCCGHYTAFWYYGPGFFNATKVRWIDESHLEIRYKAQPNHASECKSRIGDVAVVCVQTWPNNP
jgi:hypothetical protein